jgi:hypothetical protein
MTLLSRHRANGGYLPPAKRDKIEKQIKVAGRMSNRVLEMKRPLHIFWFVATLLFSLALPPLQSQEHNTGAIFDPAVYNQVPYESTLTRGLYIVPHKASVKQFAPYSGDQGQYATCTAWASAYSAFTIIYAKLNGITDRSKITQSAFSPGFAFRESFEGNFSGCSQGQVIAYVLQAMQTNGIPYYSDLDALCPSAIPAEALNKAVSYSILGYTRVVSPEDNKTAILQKVKKTISENKPVVVGMDIDNAPVKGAFNRLTHDYIWVPDRSVKPSPGHAMAIVSYDDTYGGGAFELQNSWGRKWANDGFFWIRYSDFVDYFGEAYELLENPEIANPEGSQLSGALSLEKSDGRVPEVSWNGSNYVVHEDFPSGTRFRLYLDNNEPAFVYMIGVDSAWKTYRLFPSNSSMSPALTYKRNRVALPAEDLYIETDQNPGEEDILVLYSLREIDLNKVEEGIQTNSGNLAERLQAALDNKLISFDHVSYEMDTMAFKAKSKTKGVVALLVSINHTP